MDKLIGGQAIADYLRISRRHFYRLKQKYEGTDLKAPIIRSLVGMPGRRHVEIWTTKELIFSWYFSIKNL